jgi:hypothetical protein
MRTLTLCLVALSLLPACGGSFEEARNPKIEFGAAPQSPRCADLDDAQGTWGGVALFSGALAGSSGLSAIPVPEDIDELRIGLLIGSGVSGATALASGFIAKSKATAWARECSGGAP